MLGHKNVSTTQIYADMGDESKRQSVDRITLRERSATDIRKTDAEDWVKTGTEC